MVLQRPSGFIEPCLPSKAVRPPSGPLWVHEIKHDGYRLMVRRATRATLKMTVAIPAASKGQRLCRETGQIEGD
jgi:ATP-dependent DNA ligase